MTTKALSKTKISALLNQIDDGINIDTIDWNKDAFQTLLTSNLPTKTIFYYAIDVGFRRIENSLYEAYWDETADALHDLTQLLFDQTNNKDIDAYLYEAKCQLLMWSAISIIKMNTIRRRSIHDAKMACATIFLLLLERNKSYDISSTTNEYQSCMRSMHYRYLKRIFITVQWLSTLSKVQLNDIQTNFERYMTILVNQLYQTESFKQKINDFIDRNLFGNYPDDDSISDDFLFIRQFPTFNLQNIDKYNDQMNLCLDVTFSQFKNNHIRKLVCYIWTLCCMIESNSVSLELISCSTICEHFSKNSIDFEQKPIQTESLNEQDMIVFLLLCALQNVHLHMEESTLHPYLLFALAHLCTQQQKNWWLTAIEKSSNSSNEFIDNLATIRLYDDRLLQHPPTIIILETALILLQSAEKLYAQNDKEVASSYEQYALRYLQVVKKNQDLSSSLNRSFVQANKHDKLFFFYSQNSINRNQTTIKVLADKCEQLVKNLDELKLLSEPAPPRTSSPTKEESKDINISTVLSPVAADKTQQENLDVSDSTLFATPPTNKTTRDIDVQTFIQSPTPSPPPPIEEFIEPPEPPLPAYANKIFSHMNDVNQWINRFCSDHEMIQNDINAIRDRLEKINRMTSQMMFSNMKLSLSEANDHPGEFFSPHHG